MEEDVAGHIAAGTGHTYATCTECGDVFIRRYARTVDAALDDEARSEFTELCPTCEKLDSQGERPILAGPDR
jgi:hypothetical protein